MDHDGNTSAVETVKNVVSSVAGRATDGARTAASVVGWKLWGTVESKRTRIERRVASKQEGEDSQPIGASGRNTAAAKAIKCPPRTIDGLNPGTDEESSEKEEGSSEKEGGGFEIE